jgi:DNA-directed RNA polymerase specialized sigma24 family protein
MAHYVDNKEFLAALVERRAKIAEAEKNGDPKPQVSNYIGECILKIANHLSYKPNFINYSYREEMISDGIENCLQYIDNFNPDKSNNPFAYFTQIIYYAFLRRITKEKKQTYIRGKMIQDLPMELFDTHEGDGASGTDYANTYMEYLQANHQVDDFFERKAEERKQKKLAKKKEEPSLDNFMDIDDETTSEDTSDDSTGN